MDYNAGNLKPSVTRRGLRSRLWNYSRSLLMTGLTALFFSAACQNGQLQAAEDLPDPPTPVEEAWVEVIFSQPGSPGAMDYEGGPAEALKTAIDSARFSIDMAIYNLNLWSIRDALIRAHHRGVTVRLVAESDNLDGEEFIELQAVGIQVLGDRREGLMHNKFMVIDRSDVWTGSMNFTLNSAYEDDNNLIQIHSSEVAGIYLDEFDEMFTQDLFGPGNFSVPLPEISLGTTRLEVLFSPEDGIQERLVDLLLSAERDIRFMAYSFTADALGEAIRQKAASGIHVEGIMDAGQVESNMGSEYGVFLQAGLEVCNDSSDGAMHHKVMIIDENVVVAGSYNFSSNAEEVNDENVVILHDPAIASLFLAEFHRVSRDALCP